MRPGHIGESSNVVLTITAAIRFLGRVRSLPFPVIGVYSARSRMIRLNRPMALAMGQLCRNHLTFELRRYVDGGSNGASARDHRVVLRHLAEDGPIIALVILHCLADGTSISAHLDCLQIVLQLSGGQRPGIVTGTG